MFHVVRIAALVAPAVLVAAAPAPAGSQGFEGVITARMTAPQMSAPMTVRYLLRGGRMRSEMTVGGMQAASIIDPAAGKAYVIMPARRMYMVMSMDSTLAAAPDPATAPPPKITRTGRTETVAGHICEHVLVAVEGAAGPIDACVARDVPALGFGRGGMGGSVPAWQRALGAQGGFPLKVTLSGADAAALEVTSIERTRVDPALFEVPSGYTRMEMPAGMPRRP